MHDIPYNQIISHWSPQVTGVLINRIHKLPCTTKYRRRYYRIGKRDVYQNFNLICPKTILPNKFFFSTIDSVNFKYSVKSVLFF